MNTNPSAKTILCYGDSNTFGQRSDEVSKRWPADIRWTGQLQNALGNDYYVIEEGLSSRTTDLEYTKKPGRNGKTYLLPCLQSHHPLDMVVLMLGTNDLKDVFARSAQEVARAVEGLVLDVQAFATQYSHGTQILIVSPIHINDTAQNFVKLYTTNYSHASVQKSQELAQHLKAVAQAHGCAFFDAASVATPGEDGIHLSRESHDILATALHERITALV